MEARHILCDPDAAYGGGRRGTWMPETLTESFCERCGTRYEFTAPTRLNPLRRGRGLVTGLKNYIMSQDALSDTVGDAMRSEAETLASTQLDAFHSAFNFCIDCRQYTCTNCWNDGAGRCRSCAPIAGTDDLIDRFEASFAAQHPAVGEPLPELAESDIGRRLGLDAWPSSDVADAPSNGHAAAEWPADALAAERARAFDPAGAYEPEPAAAEYEPEAVAAWGEPEPLTAEDRPEPAVEPVAAESEPEPVAAWVEPEVEPVAAESEPEPVAAWGEPEVEPVAAESEPEPVAAWGEPEPAAATYEPEAEPEPVAAESEPEPVAAEFEAAPVVEPEPVAAEFEPEPEPASEQPSPSPLHTSDRSSSSCDGRTILRSTCYPSPSPLPRRSSRSPSRWRPKSSRSLLRPQVEREPEPEPVAAEVEPEAAPEPVAAEIEPEPVVAEVEPEPEPVVPPRPSVRPIGDTILRLPRPAPRTVEPPAPVDLPQVAEDPMAAARRAQMELLGLEDPGEGALRADRPRVIPYRSSGAALPHGELADRAARQGSSAFWDASAREVADAVSQIGVQNCGQCGLSLSASARFCRRCGTRQAQPA